MTFPVLRLAPVLVVALGALPAVAPAPPLPAEIPFSAEKARQHQRRWAEHLGREVVETNSVGMKLALIPPGKFLMGSPRTEEGRDSDERQHQVTIPRPFYLGVHEVTQEEFKRVTGKNPSWFVPGGEGKEAIGDRDTSRFPVEWVTHEEAKEFCKKLSALPAEKKAGRVYRLPTEAEWEWACRGGTATPFFRGKSLSSREANCDGLRPYYGAKKGTYLERTTRVGSYSANAFGLHDMAGNVWEWCADWHGPYGAGKQTDPTGPSEPFYAVFRGGSWYFDARFCRSAERGYLHANRLLFGRSNDVGLRVACAAAGRPR